MVSTFPTPSIQEVRLAPPAKPAHTSVVLERDSAHEPEVIPATNHDGVYYGLELIHYTQFLRFPATLSVHAEHVQSSAVLL